MYGETERTIRLVVVRKENYVRKIHDIRENSWRSAKKIQKYLKKISECEATLSKLREN